MTIFINTGQRPFSVASYLSVPGIGSSTDITAPVHIASSFDGVTSVLSSEWDEGGTLYYAAFSDSLLRLASTVQAGTGAGAFGSLAVPASGDYTIDLSALASGTWYLQFFIKDGAGNDGSVQSITITIAGSSYVTDYSVAPYEQTLGGYNMYQNGTWVQNTARSTTLPGFSVGSIRTTVDSNVWQDIRVPATEFENSAGTIRIRSRYNTADTTERTVRFVMQYQLSDGSGAGAGTQYDTSITTNAEAAMWNGDYAVNQAPSNVIPSGHLAIRQRCSGTGGFIDVHDLEINPV